MDILCAIQICNLKFRLKYFLECSNSTLLVLAGIMFIFNVIIIDPIRQFG